MSRGDAVERSSPTTSRVARWAVVAVLVLPVLWWIHAAFVDPETEMLPPSLCGDWVVHPDWDIVHEPEESHPPTAFRLEVPLEVVVQGVVAELTVMGSARVRLGDRNCGTFPRDRGGWRRPIRLDLASCLPPDGDGTNHPEDAQGATVPLQVFAHSDGPSPIRVCWTGAGASQLPATGETSKAGGDGDGWRALTLGRSWRPAARAGRETSEMLDKDFSWPGGPWGYRVLLASILVLVGVAWWRGRESAGPEDDVVVEERGLRREAPSWAVLALVVGVYLWNGFAYPWWASRIDAAAHAERLRAAAEGEWLPAANTSFQAYQPPLYYVLAGSLSGLAHPGVDLRQNQDLDDLRPAQLFDAGVGIAHAFLAFWVVRRCGPSSRRARALALLTVALAPVVVTTYPMLGNETLTGLLCGTALVSGAVWLLPSAGSAGGLGSRSLGRAALAGLLGGLALLTKFTGLMPVAAVAVVLGARWLHGLAAGRPGRSLVRSALVWAAVVGCLAAPFYVARALTWGDPFIGNWDPALGFEREAEPGYRTLPFFLTFGEVFFYSPERGMWSSFWDGLYASSWGEINDSFLPIGDASVDALMLILMAFALVPTLAAIGGFASTVRRAWRHPPGLDLALVAMSAFTLSSVAVYTTRVPFANTVKALFLLSLLVPVTLFAARGYVRMERGLGRVRWVLDVVTALQILLVLRLFLWQG